jgi:hypothetical protein
MHKKMKRLTADNYIMQILVEDYSILILWYKDLHPVVTKLCPFFLLDSNVPIPRQASTSILIILIND